MRKAIASLLMIGGAVACGAKADVQTQTDSPSLVPPTPPARLIIPAPERLTLPVAEEPVPSAPTSNPSGRGRDTNPPAKPTPPPASPPPTPTPDPPPAVLRTTANTAEFEKRIRAQLGRAESDLGQVNRNQLGPEAKAQFDAARGFMRQCEEALKVKNLVYASQLADKAATMAALLRR